MCNININNEENWIGCNKSKTRMSTYSERNLRDNVWHVCMHVSWLHMTHTHTRLTVFRTEVTAYNNNNNIIYIKTHLYLQIVLQTCCAFDFNLNEKKNHGKLCRWYAHIMKLYFNSLSKILNWKTQIDTLLLLRFCCCCRF